MDISQLLDILKHHYISLVPESIRRLSGGKDNVTYFAVLSDGREVVVQLMGSIQNAHHAEYIEKVIEWTIDADPNIGFMRTPLGLPRFLPLEQGGYIQMMEYRKARNITEERLTDHLMEQIAERLGRFHRVTENFEYTPYQDINYHRDRLDEFRTLAEASVKQSDSEEQQELLKEYTKRIERIVPVEGLRIGVIHGDPVFKNFLLDDRGEMAAWIDYDMMSVTTRLWDLADMYRGYLKIPSFHADQAQKMLSRYESEFPLSSLERSALPDYIRMMTLDTGYRYLLSLDATSGFANFMGDSFEKAKRCIRDHDRVEKIFHQ